MNATMEIDNNVYADFAVLDNATIKGLFLEIARFKSKSESSKTKEQAVVFRVHFPATKELYEFLNTQFSSTKHAYHDIFFDTRHCDLIRQGLWYKQRYEYKYDNINKSLPLTGTSLKQVYRDSNDIPVTYTKVPESTIEKYKPLLRPLLAFSFIRFSFKTEFGFLWIEEVVFEYDEGYLLATAVVEDEFKFEAFCSKNTLIREALSLAPTASKVVEYIRSLKASNAKGVDELWNDLLESRTISINTSDWSSEKCKFDPSKEHPLSGKDDYWRRPGAWTV